MKISEIQTYTAINEKKQSYTTVTVLWLHYGHQSLKRQTGALCVKVI